MPRPDSWPAGHPVHPGMLLPFDVCIRGGEPLVRRSGVSQHLMADSRPPDSAVPDQHPIQALGAGCPHKPLRPTGSCSPRWRRPGWTGSDFAQRRPALHPKASIAATHGPTSHARGVQTASSRSASQLDRRDGNSVRKLPVFCRVICLAHREMCRHPRWGSVPPRRRAAQQPRLEKRRGHSQVEGRHHDRLRQGG